MAARSEVKGGSDACGLCVFRGALLDPDAPAWRLVVVFFSAIRGASMEEAGRVALKEGALF
jgi:hypothetical protein